ncbi:MAG TPA: hypothetical protein DCQ26_16825 [Marinilabiliales bacterium]|nr:MAG: hypothetical protein A2W96_04560 [Bacteroidetes bacterium GWD2_40_43]OFX88432.1 MAG: hypothetical protein A2W97_09425 [Bacteroidetes bacterium GWE2_40_63]OFY22590.1 MAG: hypothetical protein A2W88_11170 [Bacteroidetes bacterium GWF2_40_13]OFZ29595.1 MAG: hypothetical protein A2437_08845 [Bacteroidetes bacterium RIFOXYC2_FULL_40_12]HAN00260.1 hypothetical protein [Marinilabiliales bacterium]
MLKGSLFIFVFFIAFGAQAQDEKKIKQLYKDAEMHFLYEEYDLALPIYLEIIGEGWENANIYNSIGMCYLNALGQETQAIPYLEKAVTNITSNYKEGNYKEDKAPQEALFYLAKAYRITGQFDKSIQTYKQFQEYIGVNDVYLIDFVNLQIKSCETAKNMMASPIHFIETEIPFKEEGENYFPAISGDGKTMAFTAYQEIKDNSAGDGFFEIIYYSTSDGHEWKRPKDISQDLASDGYFSTSSMSYKGDMLILYGDDYGNGNLYFSTKEGSGWAPMQRFPKQISSKFNETHGSLTKDGTVLYFVSDRPGGIGGKDIYKCLMDSKGRWGVPENLGNVINTEFEEETPFLAEDGQTLYFASEAHNSMGGYDIFKSVMNENGSWSEPQNLGYPINTAADDIFYVPSGDGTVAYMARYPAGASKKKVFEIEYPQTERVIEVVAENIPVPDETLTQEKPSGTGTTNAANTETPVTESVVTQPEVKTIVVPSEYELKGRVSLQDNKDLDASFYIHVAKDDGEVIAALSPNISTGEFRTKLKHGSYKVKAFGEGYEPAEKMIFISNDQQSAEVLTFLQMVPKAVSSGEYVTIKSILFDYNSNQLNRESKIEIEKLALLMQKNPSLYVEVAGNTDSHGTDEYNRGLSLQRARAVVDYINDKGITDSRFVAKAMGKDNFIAINENPDGSDNPEGRRLNRRVDIKIVNSNNDKVNIEGIYVPDELKYKDQLTFTIFLMQTDKPLEPRYFSKSGETINNVWMFQTEGGYLYTVGKFNQKSDALTLMNVVVDAGFPDARVISNLDYNQLVQKSTNFYKSKMADTDKNVYTIQLFALKNPTDQVKTRGLKDIEKIVGSDGYTRYIWGEFMGKTSARQALSDVIQLGFYDAFIVDINRFRQ